MGCGAYLYLEDKPKLGVADRLFVKPVAGANIYRLSIPFPHISLPASKRILVARTHRLDLRRLGYGHRPGREIHIKHPGFALARLWNDGNAAFNDPSTALQDCADTEAPYHPHRSRQFCGILGKRALSDRIGAIAQILTVGQQVISTKEDP